MEFYKKNNSYKFQSLKSNQAKERTQYQIESLHPIKETNKTMMKDLTMMMDRMMITKMITEQNNNSHELNSSKNLFLIFIKKFFFLLS